MLRFVADEALKNSALWIRCHSINKRLIDLLRLKCRSHGAMRLWIKQCVWGVALKRLRVWT